MGIAKEKSVINVDSLGKALTNLFKNGNKKNLYGLVILFFAGVALLILSKTIFSPSPQPERLSGDNAGIIAPILTKDEKDTSYEETLTKQLEDILSLMDGAGRVRVMLTLSYGSEIILADDTVSDESITLETDTEGAQRTIDQSKHDERTVLAKQNDGSEKPIVLKEIMPRVEGVIIVAEGGGNIAVKAALTDAARTVLGIEIHKVHVSKMSDINQPGG